MIAKAVILQTFYGQHWQLTAVRITPYFFGVGAGKSILLQRKLPQFAIIKNAVLCVSGTSYFHAYSRDPHIRHPIPTPPQLCQSYGVLLSCKKVRSYYDLVNDSICVNALTLFEEMGKI